MKHIATTIALLLALGFALSINTAYATTSVPVSGVVRCTATGDTVSVDNLRYAAKIVGVKVNPVAGGKYYRLRSGSTISGAIIYETNSAATTSTMVMDQVQFKLPSDGLYFETDDTGANLTIFTEQ